MQSSIPSATPRWCYEQDNKWTDYDEETTKQLEENLSKVLKQNRKVKFIVKLKNGPIFGTDANKNNYIVNVQLDASINPPRIYKAVQISQIDHDEMINVTRFPALDINNTDEDMKELMNYECKYQWFLHEQIEKWKEYDVMSSKQIELALNKKQSFVILNKSESFKSPKNKNLFRVRFDYNFIPTKPTQIQYSRLNETTKYDVIYKEIIDIENSTDSNDIEALYETYTDTTSASISTSTQNHLSKMMHKIYKKRAWFNNEKLVQEYKSINGNIIPKLYLCNMNESAFMKEYEYYMNKNKDECHWLIPNILLIGADPGPSVRYLIEDGFDIFISLHEWKHNWYKNDIKTFCENMDNIQLIAFTINDFSIADDSKTVMFIEQLMRKILNKQRIYMHCLGGHGRSGLMSCLLLQAIYGMESDTAIKFLNEIHSVRHSYCGSNRMPESNEQRKQIQRLHDNMIQIYREYCMNSKKSK